MDYLLILKLNEGSIIEEGADPTQGDYLKEKVVVSSTFKHLYRKALNNLKIYCGSLNTSVEDDVKDNLHVIFRLSLARYDPEYETEVRGVIDFIKLAPIEHISQQLDVGKLFQE